MDQEPAADLWKEAYRQQFGTEPDEDVAEHAENVEQWRITWQAGYDADEEWATSMLEEQLGR
jgi:hypothetical protein